MSFDQLKSDKTFMKNIKQISEVFTKINGSTHSSIELIYNFKHMTNNILSYFSTISNQKEHIEDVLLQLVEHLSVIIKQKGSNDTNSKLLNMMANYNPPTANNIHSDTNSESVSDVSITIPDTIQSSSESDVSITIQEMIQSSSESDTSNSISDKSISTDNIKIDTSSDNISINSDSSNQSTNISTSKPIIFGY